MRYKIIILVSTLLILSGCDIPCIHPGEGVNMSTVRVNVPIKIGDNMDESKPETLWIESDLDISEDDEVALQITGEINFCSAIKVFNDPNSEEQKREEQCPSISCRDNVLVPNKWCKGGVMPTQLDPSKPDDWSCPAGGFDEDGFYHKLDLTVNSGEYVEFDIIPAFYQQIENCDKLPDGVINYSIDDLKDDKGKRIKDKNGKELDPKIICESGQVFSSPKDGGDIKLGPFKGSYYKGMVSNYKSPLSNKVYVYNSSGWLNGSIVDLRKIMPFTLYNSSFCQYTEDTSSENTKYLHPEYRYNCGASELLKYESYDINYMCGGLLSTANPGKYSSGVYSLRYLEDGVGCYRGLKLDSTFRQRAWADLLIAKIGDDNQGDDRNFSDPGEQCVYSLGNDDYDENNGTKVCMDVANYPTVPGLKLNKRYKVKDGLAPKRKLMLGIAGENGKFNMHDLSGYNVRVKKYCSYSDGRRLYLYAGTSPPTMKPGDPGTHLLEITEAGASSSTGLSSSLNFWLNPKDTDPSKANNLSGVSGKLYFGIQDAAISDTVQKSKEGYKISADNKYLVTAVQERWYPNFSYPFQVIYNAITSVFYGNVNLGDDSPVDGGVVKSLFSNISRGLIPAIQASLVLYITVYGIMFLLGMVQNTKADAMIRIIKIAFVLALCTDTSWKLFGQNLFDLFVRTTNQLIFYFSNNFTGNFETDKTFVFLDRTVGVILTREFWLRMLALLFAGPVGWLFMSLILWATGVFFAAVMEAMMTYLMIVIAIGLLLSIAPIFIAFILFQRTKQIFEGWLKMIVSFALRPMFIFASLAFLNEVLMAALYGVNQFGACTGCIISIDIAGEPVCLFKLFLPMGFSNDFPMDERIGQTMNGVGFMGLPLSITMVIVFYVVANTMRSFLNITDSMVDTITGSFMGFRSGGPADAAQTASQALLSVVGLDEGTRQNIENAKKQPFMRNQGLRLDDFNEEQKGREKGSQVPDETPGNDPGERQTQNEGRGGATSSSSDGSSGAAGEGATDNSSTSNQGAGSVARPSDATETSRTNRQTNEEGGNENR